MSDCCSPKGYRSIFSEKRAHAQARRYRRRGLDRTSRRIAELLKQQGIAGRTLLEVGGGIGAIQIELLRAGITRAVNIELSPTYEEAAQGFCARPDSSIALSAGLWTSLRPRARWTPRTS